MRFISLVSALLLSLCSFGQQFYLFIGTYTAGKSKGIYVYEFNAATGRAKPVSTVFSKNPSYLALSADGNYVYAVNEGGQPGGVSAFSFDKTKGELQLLNQQSSGGADPCYVSINKASQWVVVANYSGGSLSALPVRSDGRLDSPSQLIQHTGSGADTQRQEKPHVHSVVFSPDEHFLYAADLGIDKETIYHFDPAKQQPLEATKDSFVSIVPGSGPRHFVFHPAKPWAYLIDELSGTVDAFIYDSSTGNLEHFQRVSSHPAKYTGGKGSADIHISPDGKFLYASNRADANSIAIYSIDPADGKLQIKGFQSTMGNHPRNFIIDPTGHFLLVANKNTDNIVIFKINPQTGLLKANGTQIKIPSPVCLKMLLK
jgi:6-phosphogluconolactonase